MNLRIGTIFLTALLISTTPALLWAQIETSATPMGETVVGMSLPVEAAIKDLEHKLRVGWPLAGAGASSAVLVVPSAEMSMKDLSAVTEDMIVMGRILQTKLEVEKYSTGYGGGRYGGYGGGYGAMGDYIGYGSAAFLSRGPRILQSLYLQGYGALFTMEVDYPLAPSPEAEEATEKEDEAEVDTVWQETRMELINPGAGQRRRTSSEEWPKYDKDKVENLKTSVIEALKHASNIRALQSGDVVAVTITGQTALFESDVNIQDVVVAQDGTDVFRGDIPAGTFQFKEVMTIRANAADIKAYANGTLSSDQFRQKVQILTYPQLGGPAGR